MVQFTMTTEEMEDILEHIWGILRVDSLDAVLGRTKPTMQNLYLLDQQLMQVQRKAQQLRSEELSTWLRYTYHWSESLPTWQPLFNTSYGIMLQRHPREIVDGNLLYGLFPT